MKRNLIISIISTVLIMLWVYASLSKISEFSVFTAQLQRQPLPTWSISYFKWGLPIIELVVAFMVSIPGTRLKGFVLSSCLMISFTLYVAFALSGAFGDIPCSCAGIISGLHWKGHLIFNALFLIISLFGVHIQKKESGKENDFIKKPTMV